MCEGITKSGDKCKRKTGDMFCHQHGPPVSQVSTNLDALFCLIDDDTPPALAMLARTLAHALDRQAVTGGLNAHLVQRYIEVLETITGDNHAGETTVGDVLAELLNPTHTRQGQSH